MSDRKEKFTPGPWKIIITPCDLYSEWCIATERDSGIIATSRAFPPRFEGEANANLIAAAPDLYEALGEMRSLSEYATPQEADRVRLLADAALAKARGGIRMTSITTITKYQTTDRLEFRSLSDAEAWQAIVDAFAKVEQEILGDRVDAKDWHSGRLGYVQHSAGARNLIFGALKNAGATRDSDGAMGTLIYRANCIDSLGREWGQPYYANNPNEATNTCYEDRR